MQMVLQFRCAETLEDKSVKNHYLGCPGLPEIQASPEGPAPSAGAGSQEFKQAAGAHPNVPHACHVPWQSRLSASADPYQTRMSTGGTPSRPLRTVRPSGTAESGKDCAGAPGSDSCSRGSGPRTSAYALHGSLSHLPALTVSSRVLSAVLCLLAGTAAIATEYAGPYQPDFDPAPYPRISWTGELCEWVPGDFDWDGDVDAHDLAPFEMCSGGPGIPLRAWYDDGSPASCWMCDFDKDGDVDHCDFAAMQQKVGSTSPPMNQDPQCLGPEGEIGRKYYVSPAGNDAADGTFEHPFATPQRAASVVEPGDTVYFRGGTYYETSSTRQAVPVMEVLRSGTAGHPITFRNYEQERVVFSGSIPSMPGSSKFDAITAGTYPSDTAGASGSGAAHLIFEGLTFEDTARAGILVCGPAARFGYQLPGPPSSHITIRRCVSRGGTGWGFLTRGKCDHVVIELCEAHDQWQTGIFLGRVSKTYDDGLPEDDRNAPSHSEIRNCLAYNNRHPNTPSDTDGLGGSHTWRCAFKDNVVFTNSDDGIDIYASVEATISGNIVFDHNHPEGNGCGLKMSAGGGGRHVVSCNIALNNKAWAFETSNPSNPLTPYYANSFYNNLAYANGRTAFCLGNSLVTGTWVLRNNIAWAGLTQDYEVYDPAITNSDYNCIPASNLMALQQTGLDLHSISDDQAFLNPGTNINTTFDASWSIEQRLEHIRSQIRARFALRPSSACIDAGAVVGLPFLGQAPDIGPCEFDAP